MDKASPPEKHRAPADQYASVEPGPLPPIAPDGGLSASGLEPPAPVPAATPATMMCLRGPCRHYW
jgi:hypothetical protein